MTRNRCRSKQRQTSRKLTTVPSTTLQLTSLSTRSTANITPFLLTTTVPSKAPIPQILSWPKTPLRWINLRCFNNYWLCSNNPSRISTSQATREVNRTRISDPPRFSTSSSSPPPMETKIKWCWCSFCSSSNNSSTVCRLPTVIQVCTVKVSKAQLNFSINLKANRRQKSLLTQLTKKTTATDNHKCRLVTS